MCLVWTRLRILKRWLLSISHIIHPHRRVVKVRLLSCFRRLTPSDSFSLLILVVCVLERTGLPHSLRGAFLLVSVLSSLRTRADLHTLLWPPPKVFCWISTPSSTLQCVASRQKKRTELSSETSSHRLCKSCLMVWLPTSVTGQSQLLAKASDLLSGSFY